MDKISNTLSIDETILDQCCHVIDKFYPDVKTDHPAYGDEDYRKRRDDISKLAFTYKRNICLSKLLANREDLCKEYIDGLNQLIDADLYTMGKIPQLQDVSTFIEEKSGMKLRPVCGLLSARDFLGTLAFKQFQATQYVRHSSNPLYTIEPDTIHELLGHVPMFLSIKFVKFSQNLGLASIGASDEEIEKLATLYWFTMEYGVCYEGIPKIMKVYGAGIISSLGELNNFLKLEKNNQIDEFNIKTIIQVKYDDSMYQKNYFVTESFTKMTEELIKYSRNIKKDISVIYDDEKRQLIVHTLNRHALDAKDIFKIT
ncbi:hypothetical protein A3Q56_04148 [Intoshia linei]|uniref:Biopterin-dependent aromatic amino acid hydroxylase family profile domain-containing protein n=1 Tax=Intoshia linei TaxID=1819745 RepID=A0A177B1H0_9BILA|nr:hypothetical protein A3Q56_04148 [Intoshia linei]